jgi:glycosyltransferase involved in cell wall biosynthesis
MKILHIGYGFQPFRYGGLIVYAEDLMETQAGRGHEVSYFFCGRRYPLGPRNRLRSWTRRGVEMRELVSSTIVFGGDRGTLTPADDVAHPPSEARFVEVLDELRPDVVHVQELIGLPSSLLDLTRARGIPTVMTMHDYFTLCPVLKLFDVDGQICLRHDVGAQCARCSAGAPAAMTDEYSKTIRSEARRLLPPLAARGLLRGVALVGAGARKAAERWGDRDARSPLDRGADDRPSSGLQYQARREINVERLSGLDAAIAQSHRVAEIFTQLGVEPGRLRVLHSTVRHLDRLRPKTVEAAPRPVRFVTLNGCASVQKGSEILLGALEELDAAGLTGDFTLTVYGYATGEARRRMELLPNVDYAGYYDPSDLQRLLEPFDVGIVPSVWEEVYGYVGLELLACGLPVLGNERGGIVDYTRDGETGWVNREVSPAGLAAKIAEIVRRPEQIPELNARIRERRTELIKPFDAHVDEVLDLYAEVIDGARVRRAALEDAP